MKIALAKDYRTFTNQSANINEICRPLQQHFNITSFVYHKNFNDGSEIRLTNQPDWVEHFYNSQYYKLSGFEKHPENYSTGHVIWAHLTHHQPILNAARQFNIDHGITLINKTSDGCEFIFFGTTPSNSHLVNFYLNNIELLQRFFIYFKDKAEPIFSDLKSQRLYIPNKYQTIDSNELGIPNEQDNIRRDFINSIKINKIVLDGAILSAREIDCARLVVQGKTSKEIANLLFISPRTVESHINHLKDKLFCRIKSELIAKLNTANIAKL